MSALPFLKMHGIGNDFILCHGAEVSPPQAIALCDRRRGIGGDGVILLSPSASADFRVTIYNSDGSEAEMCGNGIRCCALYARLQELSVKDTLRFETGAGPIVVAAIKPGYFKVNMGAPVLEAGLIPTRQEHGRVIMHDLQIEGPSELRTFQITALSMGNPHAVIYATELTDELVLGWGPKIERHPFFPKRTNVEFIKVLSAGEITMRVWERGCGETAACGTGACASVVSGILNGLHGKAVTVHLPGGDLFVEWAGNPADPVYMTGPAELSFRGSVEI